MTRILLVIFTFFTSMTAFANVPTLADKSIVKSNQIQLSLGFCGEVDPKVIKRCLP
ncbi:MAG: hypothetical protein K1X44_08315 [Alphaproteobacteria bacterium]|nr:hypothetical protein [Alphaproteobacteria bacterium]